MLNAEQGDSPRTHSKEFQLLDEEGYLVDPLSWDRPFTERHAEEAKLFLTAQHWQLIELIRDKYLRLGALPPMRTVCKAVGIDKHVLKMQFGSCLALWKMAGLPNPGEEAKAYMN
jgi:TusE/DsrC/DsvC family sulfur relay protein